MDQRFYSENRRRLAAHMSSNDAMLFFSGESVRKSRDENFPFFTNRNFLYLTGLKQEQSALLLPKKGDLLSECLFVTKPDFEREIWTGRRFTEEINEISGVEGVEDINNLNKTLDTLLSSQEVMTLWLCFDALPGTPWFTVDAGIYVREWGIGLRIEDNVRVTADGCENMSAAIPATIEESECLMAYKHE